MPCAVLPDPGADTALLSGPWPLVAGFPPAGVFLGGLLPLVALVFYVPFRRVAGRICEKGKDALLVLPGAPAFSGKGGKPYFDRLSAPPAGVHGSDLAAGEALRAVVFCV